MFGSLINLMEMVSLDKHRQIQDGVPSTEVAALAGWKNFQNINEYSARSVQQQESTNGIYMTAIVSYRFILRLVADLLPVVDCRPRFRTVLVAISTPKQHPYWMKRMPIVKYVQNDRNVLIANFAAC
ncbi:hypothetical protein KUTeg_022906 [Tegillarca granosa]|uniref:Uncharacterized protein n=1 Tax=Tegillarca granosa TaxID=220873 RepID=A0ABQ9E375_TEGGR|nr:hypothetical protein KUTeg_022906 [Tegillarca granosa]